MVLQFLLGAATAALCLVAVWLTLRSSQRRHKLLRAAIHASSLSKDALLKLWGSDLGGLPGFLSAPDTHQVAWLNTALAVLWPRIDRAATAWAFEDHALETLLNSQSFWKPAWLAASGVVLQSLMLGQQPPRVTGIKVYPPDVGRVSKALLLDVTFDWASKLQVQLAMKTLQGAEMSMVDRLLGIVYSTVSVKVRVRDLVARGRMRVALSPLLDALPVVGAVRLSFLGAPAVSYRVSSFGANPMLIPGLEAWVQSFINGQVLQPFTFPEAFVLDVGTLLGLGPSAGPSVARPEGLLAVTVHSADNVPRMDVFGLSDPYVKLWLSERLKRRTSIKGYTLSPVWGECFEFVVHSTEFQALTMELWDSDAFKPDDLIGRCEVPLSSLDSTPGASNDLSLPIPRIGAEGGGGFCGCCAPAPSEAAGQGAAAAPRDGGAVPPSRPASPGMERMSGWAASPGMERTMSGGTSSPGMERMMSGATAASDGAGASAAAPPGQQRAATGRLRRLQKRAAAKLEDAFTRKGCQLNVTVQYFPFAGPEATAAAEHRQGLHPSLSHPMTPHLERVMRGGMLYVKLIRAEGLPSGRAITKQFRVAVTVGPRGGSPLYKKTAERTGVGRGLSSSDPVFDQTIDFLVDGDTAQAADAVVSVELWVIHLLLKPTCKGRVTVPLARVKAAGRLYDTWQLEGARSGRLEMALEWLSTLQAV